MCSLMHIPDDCVAFTVTVDEGAVEKLGMIILVAGISPFLYLLQAPKTQDRIASWGR